MPTWQGRVRMKGSERVGVPGTSVSTEGTSLSFLPR